MIFKVDDINPNAASCGEIRVMILLILLYLLQRLQTK